MMEISKGLQQEIQLVQSKLKNAIRDHQICVGKLKDDPDNADILERIQDIQLHIVSLGRCQKQVVQRLRKEVDDFKAVNANEVKVSVAALLGLNNNNHITANNESTNDDVTEVKVVTNGLDNARLTPAKEDYEEVVRNGDVTTSPQDNNLSKERSVSVETLSADDEEIIEVSVNEERRENKRQMSEEPLAERRIKCTEQLTFLEVLGLITTLRSTELQNRRAERKRRSTANPQFIYSNWEMPMKRKRHNYLQSAGNVPQTRQTTARLNGPSPPPICNKSATSLVPPKSTSPPSQKISKSLIPTQKGTTRPNILRNMSESRVYPCKSSRIENGNGQLQISTSSTRTTQSTPNSKTVLIPGLPSGLTIERIESDSAVCINCRNPGTLTTCDNCEANYHVSCHSISPPPPRLCPKCALRMSEATPTIKKNDELAATSYAPGVAGKAGEDPEVNKASGGFHKVGTNSKQQQQQQQTIVTAGGRGVNELSTILIPISTNAIAATVDVVQSGVIVANESSVNVVEPDGNSDDTVSTSGNASYSTSIVIGNQLSRSSVTYVPQSDDKNVPYAYELPIVDKKSTLKQPLFYVKKMASSRKESSVEQRRAREERSKIGNDSNVRFVETRNEITITDRSRLDKLTGSLAESISRGWKKSTTRAIPALTRIVKQSDDSTTVSSQHGNDDNVDELQSCSYNSRGSTSRERHEARTDGTANRNDCEIADRAGKSDKVEGGRKSENSSESLFSRAKCRPKSGGILHSLFAGYNKPDNVADCTDDARKSAASNVDGNGTNDESDELERNESEGDRSQCSSEHVKLEEAHLSAPLRAKLIVKKESNDKALIEREISSNLLNATRDVPSRRRTTDDSASTSSLFRGNVEGKQERRQLPRILMRAARRSLESRENNETELENLKVVSFERKYSNSFVRLPNKGKKLPDEESNNDSDTSATDDAMSPVNMFDENSDKNLDDDDGEDDDDRENGNSEKKDLSEENGPNPDSGGDLQIDEETDDNEEEIDDVEDQDCPIVDEEMKNETSKGFRIGTVSPESMRVLEQFESAMLQVDSGDKTANP